MKPDLLSKSGGQARVILIQTGDVTAPGQRESLVEGGGLADDLFVENEADPPVRI